MTVTRSGGSFRVGLALVLASSLVGCVVHSGPGGSSSGVVSQQAATGSGPATIAITNNSAESIYYVYMSPVSQDTWGEDRLGSAVLSAGETLSLSNVPPGNWDLRVVDRSGNHKDWRDQQIEPGGFYNLAVSAENWSR